MDCKRLTAAIRYSTVAILALSLACTGNPQAPVDQQDQVVDDQGAQPANDPDQQPAIVDDDEPPADNASAFPFVGSWEGKGMTYTFAADKTGVWDLGLLGKTDFTWEVAAESSGKYTLTVVETESGDSYPMELEKIGEDQLKANLPQGVGEFDLKKKSQQGAEREPLDPGLSPPVAPTDKAPGEGEAGVSGIGTLS